MEFFDKIKELWKSCERMGLPSNAWDSGPLTLWRERILFIVILMVIVFGFVRLIPIMILSNIEGQWLIAGLTLLAWLSAVFILYNRRLPIACRTWILCFTFYMFGISLLYFFGLDSAGHDWFFRASVIAGIILGMRAAVIALSFNFILLLLIAVLISTGSSAWVSQDAEVLKLWLVVLVNSMIANTIITFGIVLLFDGIDKLLFKSQETVNSLRESEEKLKGTFEASPDPMVVYNVDGYPQYLNSAFVDVFGWTMEELAGKRIPFVPKEQEKICKQQIDQLFRTGSPVEIETKRITKYGKIIEVLLKAAVIRDPKGKPMGTIVNLADITGSKKLEKQLRQARKMEAIGTLAGGIAHDFNNILQIINGYADITIMDKDKNGSDYSNLQTILDAADRAAKLIRQLLLFSRKVETETKVLNPNHEIKQAAHILSRTIPKMVKIHTHLSERLWNVKADPVQIEQVFLNLGSNAADAMPTGGKMVMKTANVRITKETIHDMVGINPGDYVLLTITDNGHGIEKGVIEHIFEPFFTTKDVGKGTGLGLASAYGIVKKHNGHITCRSQPGKGTVFKIYLPAYKEKEWVTENMDDTTTLVGGTETVLIIDDEATIRGFSSKALGHFGYSVIDCSSGEDALDIFSKQFNDIDLILLDIGMPGMGGYKCFEEMLKINPDAKIMITTGYSKDEKIKKALNAGAASYLGKPYKLSFLLKSVRKTLDEKTNYKAILKN
ncbi:MAG: PAS domain S-box protein [Desulfobacteraceae bacterium]|nr:PAS domain S-box protein [Desulfobacteraceae bacterium]